MRKTEMVIGVSAGVVGALLGLLFLFDLFPQSEIVADTHNTVYAIICIAANVLGVVGAIAVQKRHIIGSVLMAVAMIAIVLFGFPWQMIPAVAYAVSVVLAAVPEKLHE